MTYKKITEKYRDSDNLALPGKPNLWRDREWNDLKLSISATYNHLGYNEGQSYGWVFFYRYGVTFGQHRHKYKKD